MEPDIAGEAPEIPPLVESQDQAVDNIRRYNAEVEAIAYLIPYTRAWYALREKDGRWLFGPSKFIGYQGLTADLYDALNRNGLDGRPTERRLARWATPVEAGDPEHAVLREALLDFCARLERVPNNLARIAVIRDETPEPPVDQLVPLLAAVYRTLTAEQKRLFKRLTDER